MDDYLHVDSRHCQWTTVTVVDDYLHVDSRHGYVLTNKADD